MNCFLTRELLIDYPWVQSVDELPDAVHPHLKQCPECMEWHKKHQQIVRMIQPEVKLTPRKDFADRVLNAVKDDTIERGISVRTIEPSKFFDIQKAKRSHNKMKSYVQALRINLNRLSSKNTKFERLARIIKRFPSPSPVIAEIERLSHCKSRELGTRELAKIVKIDGALCANILRFVRSAYYGYPNIKTIELAVTVLGIYATIDIIRFFLLHMTFRSKVRESFIIWKHSLKTAIIAQECIKIIQSRQTSFHNPYYMFLLGLLHEAGKMFLLNYSYDDFVEIANKALELNIDFSDAANLIINTNECELAFYLLKHWKFPESICIPIKYYHNIRDIPKEYDYLKRDILLLHLADELSKKDTLKLICSGSLNIDNIVFSLIGLPKKALNLSFYDTVEKQFKDEMALIKYAPEDERSCYESLLT